MVYEWDPAKARRAHVLKILAAWGAAVTVAGFPVLVLIHALSLSN
ncbi:hypothetical protein [Pararhizobium qamdonense]|nr:hypothetical protein [Pararhizobium qamdonense]